MATVRAAALAALAACVPLSLLSGWRAAVVHLVAVGSAWAYNAGVKATVLSPLPYAVSFGLLPAFVTLGLPAHPWPRPTLMGATALLGVGAHFVNTLADRDDDARSGIAGLPQRMSARACLFTGVVLLSACAVAIWALGGGSPVVRAVLLAACLGAAAMVVVTTLRDAPRAAWSWTLVTVLGCLVLFAVARPSLVGMLGPDHGPRAEAPTGDAGNHRLPTGAVACILKHGWRINGGSCGIPGSGGYSGFPADASVRRRSASASGASSSSANCHTKRLEAEGEQRPLLLLAVDARRTQDVPGHRRIDPVPDGEPLGQRDGEHRQLTDREAGAQPDADHLEGLLEDEVPPDGRTPRRPGAR